MEKKEWTVVGNRKYIHTGGYRFKYKSIEEACDLASLIANAMYKDGVNEYYVFVVKRNKKYPMDDAACTVYCHYSILHENDHKKLILNYSWSNNSIIIKEE